MKKEIEKEDVQDLKPEDFLLIDDKELTVQIYTEKEEK